MSTKAKVGGVRSGNGWARALAVGGLLSLGLPGGCVSRVDGDGPQGSGGAALVTLPHADVPALLRTETVLDSFVAVPYRSHVAEADVYDLTVERDHNYFAEGVLVHNKSGGGPSVSTGACTHAIAETTVQVCSGPAEVGFRPHDDNPAWFIWHLPPEEGLGGEPDAGLGGASGADDAIVVAFEVCGSSTSPYHAAYSPYVAPRQRVLVGMSQTGPCTEPEMFLVGANEFGGSIGGVGWAHVSVPVDEFECLYLAAEPDLSLCAITAAD